MGFIVMVLSAIIGIVLVIAGVTHIKNAKNKIWNIVSILVGIALVVFAVWLGLPK